MNKDLIKIRQVQLDDAENWYLFKNSMWKTAYKDIFPTEVFDYKDEITSEKVSDFKDNVFQNKNKIAYVAEYDGKIVGIMKGAIKSIYDYFHDDYADLIALYIDSDFQGLGIGTEFRNIFAKWAKENGATKYVIGVFKDNHKARKVYEAWGGILSDYEQDLVVLDVGYPEVFYTYDL